MLLNEDPCKGCKDKGIDIVCACCHWQLEVNEYHAQRELLGKVVEWLENFGNEPRWVTYKHKAKVIAKELKKELQG